jgi:hypothetical protein
MALSSLLRLRRRIQDRRRVVTDEVLGLGDGAKVHFRVHLAPVVEGSLYLVKVAGGATTSLVEETDYIVDLDLGLITFVAAPADGAKIVASAYQWVTFTDEELNDWLEMYGDDVRLAAMAAVRSLLADQERFIKYTFGQEQVDRGRALQALQALLEELAAEGGAPVGIVKANTTGRKNLMDPFLEQAEGIDA